MEKGYLHKIVRNLLSKSRQICDNLAHPSSDVRNEIPAILRKFAICDKFAQSPLANAPLLGISETKSGVLLKLKPGLPKAGVLRNKKKFPHFGQFHLFSVFSKVRISVWPGLGQKLLPRRTWSDKKLLPLRFPDLHQMTHSNSVLTKWGFL